jgi:Ca2+/H+ antiporter, TMEM165/GDT1 family
MLTGLIFDGKAADSPSWDPCRSISVPALTERGPLVTIARPRAPPLCIRRVEIFIMSDAALSPLTHWLWAAGTTFGVIFLAELGDKSQLVCMTLAARHRRWPVLIGAVAAFIILNSLAVVFGVGLSQWIPERVLAAVVAILFAVFGVLALRAEAVDEDAPARNWSHNGIVAATFSMIFLAEMGDKTQLAVAGLAVTLPPLAVWVGATAALALTSALGVWVGCRLLQVMPLHRLHQLSGLFFLVLAGLALTRVF